MAWAHPGLVAAGPRGGGQGRGWTSSGRAAVPSSGESSADGLTDFLRVSGLIWRCLRCRRAVEWPPRLVLFIPRTARWTPARPVSLDALLSLSGLGHVRLSPPVPAESLTSLYLSLALSLCTFIPLYCTHQPLLVKLALPVSELSRRSQRSRTDAVSPLLSDFSPGLPAETTASLGRRAEFTQSSLCCSPEASQNSLFPPRLAPPARDGAQQHQSSPAAGVRRGTSPLTASALSAAVDEPVCAIRRFQVK